MANLSTPRTTRWSILTAAFGSPIQAWVGDGYDGVHIFAPNGDRIGLVRLPEICSNVCFGGSKRNRLFMTGSQSLYAVYVETQGAHIN
jgi:gluconolactonase